MKFGYIHFSWTNVCRDERILNLKTERWSWVIFSETLEMLFKIGRRSVDCHKRVLPFSNTETTAEGKVIFNKLRLNICFGVEEKISVKPFMILLGIFDIPIDFDDLRRQISLFTWSSEIEWIFIKPGRVASEMVGIWNRRERIGSIESGQQRLQQKVAVP